MPHTAKRRNRREVVGEGGLEPPPLARHGPKPCACTNSATRPMLKEYNVLLYFAYAPIAQLVEQIPLKDKVPGSSPGGRTCSACASLCREWDSNPHAAITQQEILSLWRLPFRHLGKHSYSTPFFMREARAGIEPAHNGFADRRVTISPSGRWLIILYRRSVRCLAIV